MTEGLLYLKQHRAFAVQRGDAELVLGVEAHAYFHVRTSDDIDVSTRRAMFLIK